MYTQEQINLINKERAQNVEQGRDPYSGSYQDTINSRVLKPQSEIKYYSPKPSPIYDITKLTPELEPTKPEQEAQDLTTRLRMLNEQLTGESQYRATQERDFGLQEKMQAQKDLERQMKSLQNEALAIPIQLQNQVASGGVTTSQLRQYTDAELRKNAIKALSINSLLEASRGNLATAQEMVDRAVAQKYDPIKESIDAKKKNLELILASPEYTLAEKNRAQRQLQIQKQLEAKTDAEKDEQQKIYDIALSVAKNGGNAVILNQIRNAKTKGEALLIASRSGKLVDPKDLLELEKKRLEIQKLKSNGVDTVKVPSYVLNASVARGVPADVSQGIYDDLREGYSLEAIRQNLMSQFGQDTGYKYLDTFLPIYQEAYTKDSEREL